MKVTVTLAIDVDPAAWTEAYGVEGANAIRKDVRGYVVNAAQSLAPVDEGGFRSVELRP